MSRTLVCIVCELRATRLTFETFNENLLKPNNADLLLCIARREGKTPDNDYVRAAKYTKIIDEPDDFTPLYDEYAKRWNSTSNWRRLARIGRHWMGGLRTERSLKAFGEKFVREMRRRDFPTFSERFRCAGGIVKRLLIGRGAFDQTGAAGIVMVFRQLLLDMLKDEKLLEKYDRFIITRSDYFYAATHPTCDLLDPQFVWLPEGEDYRGLCDRHWILSREHVEPCLDLLGPIINETDVLFREMQPDNRWNIEKYIKHVWTRRGIRVKRYPRTLYLVRDRDDNTSKSEGTFNPEAKMVVKYKTEYEGAKANVEAFKDAESWKAWCHNGQLSPVNQG